MVGTVFVVDFQSLTNRGSATKRSKVVGPIERIDCSNRSVKSKFERHPWTAGPKASSMYGGQVDAIVTARRVHAS